VHRTFTLNVFSGLVSAKFSRRCSFLNYKSKDLASITFTKYETYIGKKFF